MKKAIVLICVIAAIIACILAFNFSSKSKEEVENVVSKESNVENVVEEETKKEGFDVLVSKKELTIVKGSEESFDITFTNPDLTSIREYIHCDDQSDIVLVKYTDLIDGKINVYVEGLKAGDTEIEVCDFNYQDVKEIVKVHVVENN